MTLSSQDCHLLSESETPVAAVFVSLSHTRWDLSFRYFHSVVAFPHLSSFCSSFHLLDVLLSFCRNLFYLLEDADLKNRSLEEILFKLGTSTVDLV
ncbi:hypothetical protein L1887_30584 [Cichorium endivia]|nr:hypothetical protein L1887_30584 [Cichorium endivia]